MQVDVINTALGLLGKEPVADLSETSLQNSTAAVKLMRSVEQARKSVLSRHGWKCAKDYATLSPATLSAYVNWRYPVVFLAPNNALSIWEVAGNILDGRELGFTEPRWEIGRHEVGAASQFIIRVRDRCLDACVDPGGSLNIAYIRNASWASLDQHVEDAIAAETARRQARSILGEQQTKLDMAKEAETAVQLAIGLDGAQEGGQPALAPSIPAAIRGYARGAGAELGPWGRGY